MNQLPAGLFDCHVEFFACIRGELYCFKDGEKLDFEHFPAEDIALLENSLLSQPAKVAELKAMGLTGRMETIKQFGICNYGGFDNQADVVDGELQPTEYWPCPKRGICPHEGKLCDSLRTETGQYLTRREIEILKHVAMGLLDKEIADTLKIFETTVKTHTKNIRIKTGLFRKAELTRFAVSKHLI